MAGLETTLITIPQGWHPLLELALIITIGVTFGCVVYRLEQCIKEEWIPLQKYRNLSRMKADFLMSISKMMKREEILLRMVDETNQIH